VLERGLKQTYRQARKAHEAAQAQPTVENLHEWRKQTKYLWHQLQLLERLSPGFVGELIDEMHALSDYLGDDHDLAVLRSRAFELLKAELNEKSGSAIKALIDRRRAELQAKALKLGERLYADKPKSFARRFGSNSRVVTQPSPGMIP
jgi:CHAD domain-containing protein